MLEAVSLEEKFLWTQKTSTLKKIVEKKKLYF